MGDIFYCLFKWFCSIVNALCFCDSNDGKLLHKASENKAKGVTNAIIYGISIIIIYVALGVGVSAVFGADALNNMATNVYFNIAFFLLLIVFAASFLGAFDLTLPALGLTRLIKLRIGEDDWDFLHGFHFGFGIILLYWSV